MSGKDGPQIGLCTGKDCRRADGYRTVERELRRSTTVVDVPCLDICHGAVVVLRPRSSDPVVLERVSGRGLALEVVEHVVDDAELSGRLRKRRIKGSARSKARRRIARAL